MSNQPDHENSDNEEHPAFEEFMLPYLHIISNQQSQLSKTN